MISHLLLVTFFTNVIHALQQQWNKFMDHKEDYVEK